MSSDVWKAVESQRGRESEYYGVFRLMPDADGMSALREFFPDAKADTLNFVLFSTSGVHGSYATIEEVEARLPDVGICITFLVVCPRQVRMHYGNVVPRTAEDIEFLKSLRTSSWRAALAIGAEK